MRPRVRPTSNFLSPPPTAFPSPQGTPGTPHPVNSCLTLSPSLQVRVGVGGWSDVRKIKEGNLRQKMRVASGGSHQLFSSLLGTDKLNFHLSLSPSLFRGKGVGHTIQGYSTFALKLNWFVGGDGSGDWSETEARGVSCRA